MEGEKSPASDKQTKNFIPSQSELCDFVHKKSFNGKLLAKSKLKWYENYQQTIFEFHACSTAWTDFWNDGRFERDV